MNEARFVAAPDDGDRVLVIHLGLMLEDPPDLDPVLQRVGDDVRYVVFDVEQAQYVTPYGVAALLQLKRELERRGQRVCCVGNDLLQRTVEVCGIQEFLPVLPTIDAAIQRLREDRS